MKFSELPTDTQQRLNDERSKLSNRTAVNEAQKNYELAKKLWGDENENQ
jgi:hypothetical protein